MRFIPSVLALLSLSHPIWAAPAVSDHAPSGSDVTTTDPPPDPNTVYVQSITYAGTGCPAGSVAGTFSKDRSLFTLSFDSYVASTDRDSKITESFKNCLLTIRIHYPGGYQYSIFRAQYQGFAAIPEKMWGTQSSVYNFAASGQTCKTQSRFNGPYSQNYLVADEIPQETVVWSPCGVDESILKINSQIQVGPFVGGPNQAAALMTTDSIDGSFKHIMSMQWKKCVQ